jgi:hypothetical protein
VSTVATRRRPGRTATRRGIIHRAALRRDHEHVHRALAQHRRRDMSPAAGFAHWRNARLRASAATDALGEHLHDGTRHAPPELIAAIDTGDHATVRAIEARWLDREMGAGTGRLYLKVHALLDVARRLEHAYATNLACRVLDARIAAGEPIGFAERVTIIRGPRGTR